jgi:hypothetical protein
MAVDGVTILDFYDGFIVTESPVGEVNISVDPDTVQYKSEKGIAGGYASLNSRGMVVQYPGYVAWTAADFGAIPLGNPQLDASWGGEPNTLATLDGAAKVVEDPANATATPTANAIPIADSSGKLDAWVSTIVAPVAGPWEIYISLGSEPMTI